MKKSLVKLCGMFMIFTLTGCVNEKVDMSINPDGSAVTEVTMYIEKSVYDSMGLESDSNMTIVNKDGVDYYASSEVENLTAEGLKEEFPVDTVTPSVVYIDSSTINGFPDNQASVIEEKKGETAGELAASVSFIELQISLPNDIVKTNGTLVDNDTVVWTIDTATPTNEDWYAYTQAGLGDVESDTTPPSISGTEDNDVVNTEPSIKVDDNTGVDDVTVNGNTVIPGQDITYKDGENIVTVTDLSGNSTTVKFTIDKKKPTIKGLKQNKVYKKKVTFYVKDNVKVSKIKVDNKKVSKNRVKKGKYKNYYKVTVKKKGKHKVVVTDTAGNSKTIKFRVK